MFVFGKISNIIRRTRRDLNAFLIMPYTKYCGVGWSAKRYSDIGGFSKTGKVKF